MQRDARSGREGWCDAVTSLRLCNQAQEVVLDSTNAELKATGSAQTTSELFCLLTDDAAARTRTHDFVRVVACAHHAQADLAVLLDADLRRAQRTSQHRLRTVHACTPRERTISSVDT